MNGKSHKGEIHALLDFIVMLGETFVVLLLTRTDQHLSYTSV